MGPLILTALQVAGQLAPLVTSSGQVATIINLLKEVVPIGIQTIQGAAPLVANIVTTVKGNAAITPEQWNELDAIEAKIDAEWDAAKAQAQSADKK